MLAASALADASRRGVPSIRVTDGATWWLVPEPAAINSDSSQRSSGFPGDLANNGQERDRGSMPQAAMPQPLPGHAYFVGPWHRITPNVLRQLVLYDISRLGLRVGVTWIVVPLPLRLIRASYFRLRPLLSYFRGIVLGTRRLRAAAARLVLRERPTAIESAVLIAGPAGFGEASLPHVFEAMVRNRSDQIHAVPRRILQICGSLQPGGAERQVAYTLRCLSQTNIESVQLLCHFLTHGGEHRYDFYLPMIDTAVTGVREIRRQSRYPEMPDLPPALRDIMRLLPLGLAVDICGSLFGICRAQARDRARMAGLGQCSGGICRRVGRRAKNYSFRTQPQPYAFYALSVLYGSCLSCVGAGAEHHSHQQQSRGR